jgi:hypothetical protein
VRSAAAAAAINSSTAASLAGRAISCGWQTTEPDQLDQVADIDTVGKGTLGESRSALTIG